MDRLKSNLLKDETSVRTVEESAGETRVTLRPAGCGRVFLILFLSVWLCGWAFGEVAVIGALSHLFGFSGQTNVPPALRDFSSGAAAVSLSVFTFLLLWLTFWTVGGVAAIGTVLRTAFGRDLFTFQGDRWIVWRGVGPFGFEREFSREGFSNVYLRRKDRALALKGPSKVTILTSLGAEQDRTWLRDEIGRRYGLIVGGAMHGSSSSALVLPERWESRHGDGGKVIIVTSASKRRGLMGCLLVFGVPLLAWIVWRSHAILTYELQTGPGDFVGAGAAILYLMFTVWCMKAEEAWHVGKNRLSHSVVFGPWRRSKEIRDARVDVEYLRDSDGDDTFTAVAVSGDQELRLYSSSQEPVETVGLARFIAHHAGWPVYVAREAEDESVG